MKSTISSELRDQFKSQVHLEERRPGIFQVFAPLYHEDGDMLDIFIEECPDKLRVCNLGQTLMRLSYTFDLDTDNKQQAFHKLLLQNGLSFDDEKGNIFLDTSVDSLYPSLMQFAQGVAKVSRLDVLKHEVVSALFFEMVQEFILKDLAKYNPEPNVFPIPGRDELEIPWAFKLRTHPVYLFPVRLSSQALLATIAFLELQKAKIKFKGFVAYDDSEALTAKDRRRLMSAADKQFYSLDDFKNDAGTFLAPEDAA